MYDLLLVLLLNVTLAYVNVFKTLQYHTYKVDEDGSESASKCHFKTNKNLAITKGSRVSCAHNMPRASMIIS